MTRRRQERQLWIIPTVLLFVVVPVGAAVYSAIASGRDTSPTSPRPKLSRAGSTFVGRAAEPLPIAAEPSSYEVVYSLERYDATKIHRSRDRIQIRRPFEGRVEDAEPGREPKPRISRVGTLVLSTGAGPRSLVSPPTPATGDLRLKPVLETALTDKLLELQERRRVLGRACQVYRAGSSVTAGELVPVGSRPAEYSDFCVDGDGILLEEVWWKDGRPLQRRIAVDLEVDVPFTDALFELPDEIQVPFEEGNGYLRPIDPASGFEGTMYRLAEVPPGFEYLGRYVVSPPRLNPFESRLDESAPRSQVSIVDIWQRGPDALVLTQIIAADISAVPQNSPTAKELELPAGRGASVFDLRSSEVRISLPEDRFLVLSGTLPPSDLVEAASSLRAETGTGLRFLDE